MLANLSTVGAVQLTCMAWVDLKLAISVHWLCLQVMYLSLFELSVLAWFCSLAFATTLAVPFFTTVVTYYILGWTLSLWMSWPCSAAITVLSPHSIFILGSDMFPFSDFPLTRQYTSPLRHSEIRRWRKY